MPEVEPHASSKPILSSPLRAGDRCRFAASLQSSLNLVRDFEKNAPKRPSELAQVDAPYAFVA